MSSSNDSNMAGFLAGAVIDGAVGAVAALLLAPKSGREIRDDIAERSEDLYDKAKDYFVETEEGAEEVVNEGRLKAERIVSSAREQAQTLLNNAEQVLTDARSRSRKVKEKVESGSSKVAEAAKAGAEAFRTEIK